MDPFLPVPGELYDIGWGQKLYLSCKGSGAPTVILDAPTGLTSDAWGLVVEKIAKYTRVGFRYYFLLCTKLLNITWLFNIL